MRRLAARLVPIAALAAIASTTLAKPFNYPKTEKVDVVDNYHGTKVADPYRWLEDDVRVSSQVRDWVTRQNELTFSYLETLPMRDTFEKRLTELWNYERYSAPSKVGTRYVYSYNNGLQNQSVLYIQDSLSAEPRVLIDPNEWSKEGTVALAGTVFSEDGKYLAFGKSVGGSDWSTWHVMDVDTQEVLDDELKWIKFSSASWTPDGKGFFYSRFPTPGEGDAFQALNLNSKVYYHRVGTDQSKDVLVYEDPDNPTYGFFGSVTDDGRYLLIYVSTGTDDRNKLLVRDLTEPFAIPTALVDNFEYGYSVIGNDGPIFYIETDNDAPNKRIVTVDVRRGMSSMKELIAEANEPLSGSSITGNLIVCSYLKDVQTVVKMYTTDGKHVRDVAFPGIGVVSGFGGKRSDTEVFYDFSSMTTPPTIYRYSMITGESEVFRQAKVDFDPSQYTVSQVFYTSKDGTKVPMFLAHKKGIKLDGTNPTLIYAYGGFNISLLPYFSITRIAWMEQGGVYAMPNLRGGGEYGKTWHKAGTKTQKQNVFDDFIAGAQWLIDNNYTSPEHLGMQGGSNGGLLVGAVMAQRPDLYAVALPAVGVMDMLRFQRFTAGRYWVDDYGSSDNPEEFKAQYAYSPYHNLKDGTEYPATLVTTADYDDRVVPGHSFKFTARLQEAHRGDNPVMIRIETDAGHGAGKPVAKRIDEIADLWAFLAKHTGMRAR